MRAQDPRQQLDARLHRTLRPAVGLLLKGDHLRRKLRRRAKLRKVHELPALKLAAIRKIKVFSERVVLPAATVVDRRAAPHARGAVEMHEPAAAVARGVFDDEMTVEEDRLRLSQQ